MENKTHVERKFSDPKTQETTVMSTTDETFCIYDMTIAF
jgi:hypothetical protein